MARNLSDLQKQYTSVSHGFSLRGGGPGRGHGPRGKGKPQDALNTVKRLLYYVGKYKARLVVVFICFILLSFLFTLAFVC